MLLPVGAANFVSAQNSYATTGSNSTGYEMIQYPLPNGSSWPFELATDSLGHIWVVEQQSNQLGMFNPSTLTWQEYSIPTPDSTPNAVAVDASGNVWVTGLTSNKLAVLRNGSSQMIEYSIPNRTVTLANLVEPLTCGPIEVQVGPNQNIWIFCDFSNQIDEFFPANSTFAQYNLPVWYSGPVGLAFDKEGNFWFTAADANMLGHAVVSELRNGTTDGITEFAPMNSTYVFTFNHPTDLTGDTSNITSSLPTPAEIAFGPDGTTLWITEHVDSSFDSYNTVTKSLDRYWLSQTYMEYGYPIAFPNGLAVDSSGNVWMAEHYGNKVAEFDPTTGTLTEYAVPCCSSVPYTSPGAGVYWLTIGKGGTIWFVEIYGDKIGELEPINSAQSVNFNVANNVVSFGNNQHSSATVPIQVEYSGLSSENGTEIKLSVAGTSSNGTLVGMKGQFSPETINVSQSGTVSSNLTLTDQSLKPGIYDLTITANLTGSNTIYSTILKVEVGAPNFSTLIAYGAVVAVIASATVVVLMSRRRRLFGHRR